jgi:thiamine pyrophosphate-dependent acetolactate synthase large subunit-like protein
VTASHSSDTAAHVEAPVELPTHRPAPAFGSDLVVDLLHDLGIRYLPLNPGSSFRGLHDSLVNHGGNRAPQLLLCLHEEIAVSLAHGYAKATGGIGAAAVHDLVGLMHASMAVYGAFCDRAPLLVLGGSGPVDPTLRRAGDWIHSATTQSELVRDFVVWDAEPMTPHALAADVLRAHQRALSGPRGPAYVSLDAGVQEMRLDGEPPALRLSSHAPAPPMAPDPVALDRAADMLIRATRPVVVGGRVGLLRRATPLLVELVELIGAAYRDDRNIVAFPTAHPQNLTGEQGLLAEADVVLGVDVVDLTALLRPKDRGARGTSETPAAAPTVVDLSYGDLGMRSWSNAFTAPVERDVQLLAEPMLGLEQLIAAVAHRVDARFRAVAEARRADLAARSVALKKAQEDERARTWAASPISPSRLVAETWEAVRDDDVLLCLRNTRTWPEGVWQFAGAGDYLGHSGGGGVGYGPGALVGGALAARDQGRLGVGIIGDGDLLMAAGALWTAVHYGIPALVVVNDNASFFNDEPHQAEVARHRGRPVANSWIGMRITDPPVDIAALARSYGCWASDTVTDPDDLAPALAAARRHALDGEVAVVHVRTGPT